MKYVYMLFLYEPKHKYNGFVYEGRYNPRPLIFENYDDARSYKKTYRHTSFIRRTKLR